MITWGRSTGFVAVLLMAVCVAIGCSSVTVETGPRSQASAEAASTDQAGNIRSLWADRFAGANPVQGAAYLKLFIDSTSARYLDFGNEIALRWRDENDRQGRDVPASAMADMVDRSIATQRPVFAAYDDVVDLGMRYVRDSAYFEPEVESLVRDMYEEYHEIRRFVFQPAGVLAGYRAGLEDKRRDLQEVSRRLDEELARFR